MSDNQRLTFPPRSTKTALRKYDQAMDRLIVAYDKALKAIYDASRHTPVLALGNGPKALLVSACANDLYHLLHAQTGAAKTSARSMKALMRSICGGADAKKVNHRGKFRAR